MQLRTRVICQRTLNKEFWMPVKMVGQMLALFFIASIIMSCNDATEGPLIIDTPTPIATNTPNSDPTPVDNSPVPPSPTPTPTIPLPPTSPSPTDTPTPASLRLGYTNRGMNCPFITEIIEIVLTTKLNISVSTHSFNTADDLFAALGKKEVDVTLCFIDPLDRPYSDSGGYTKQIGSTYWNDGQHKWKIFANGKTKMDLREDRQCIFYFFEDLNFTEIEDQDQDAWGWVQNHEGEVQAWISCVPSE